MTVFKSLPQDAHLMHIFKRFPKATQPLLELHDAILRSESDLSVGERELIAAYTSLHNACRFCYGAHSRIAQLFDMDESTLQSLEGELTGDNIDPKLIPLLNYVKKLTLTPAQISQADADAVYAAGWSEEALFDAISTCALFNYMNRIVDGSNIEIEHKDIRRPQGKRPDFQRYTELADHLDNYSIADEND